MIDNLFLEVIKMKEYPLHKYLISLLKSYDYEVKHTMDFIYATHLEPTAEVCLAAHLDTVWRTPPEDDGYIYDAEKDIMIGLEEGIGADDRAGVYIVLKLLESGHRPSGIIFTHDEEIGGRGAYALIGAVPEPTANFKYILQLDRQGKDDCVFYDCDNIEFTKYIESFGWKTQRGTMSDISIIAPAWKIAAVNVSVGYFNEHFDNEYVKPKYIEFNIISRVEHMLADAEYALSFSYIKKVYTMPVNDWKRYPADAKPFTFKGDSDTCYYCGRDIINGITMTGFYETYMICRHCAEKHHPQPKKKN